MPAAVAEIVTTTAVNDEMSPHDPEGLCTDFEEQLKIPKFKFPEEFETLYEFSIFVTRKIENNGIVLVFRIHNLFPIRSTHHWIHSAARFRQGK